MDRLIAANSVPQSGADTAPVGGTPQYATDGSPGIQLPTQWPAYQYNAMQEELLAIEIAGAQTPDRTNNGQVLAAILTLIGAAVPTPLITASHSYGSNDANQILERSNAGSAMGDTLPGTTPGVLARAWRAVIVNNDASALLSLTVGAGALLNGIAGRIIYLGPGQSLTIVCDGVNYWAVARPDRCRLAAASSLFVATTGSDSNDGLSAATPFATLQKAWNVIQQHFDLDGQSLNISIGAGTFTAGVSASGQLVGSPGAASVVFNGAGPASTTIAVTNGSAFLGSAGSNFSVANLALSASGTGAGQGFGISAGFATFITFSNVAFGSCGVSQVYANFGGVIDALAAYSITAGAPNHLKAQANGTIFTPVAVTVTGTPAFSNAFAYADMVSTVDAIGASYAGSATGTRYSANSNGVINTNGGGANFFPGSIAGAAATGGQYL